MASVEVVGHSEGLQYTNGWVLQVGVEGLSHDLRGERCLAWATLYVQVRCVAQGMHSGISAARDSEPDRLDRLQPLGSLLREQYWQAATAMAKARGTVNTRSVARDWSCRLLLPPKPVIDNSSPPGSSVPQQRDDYPSRPQLRCREKQEGIICSVCGSCPAWDVGPQERSFRPGQCY